MITKNKFKEIMIETECGWKSQGEYKNIGCPSDVDGITPYDEPTLCACTMDCEDCWNYVLNNKKWEGEA